MGMNPALEGGGKEVGGAWTEKKKTSIKSLAQKEKA